VEHGVAALVRRLGKALIAARAERDRIGPFDSLVAQLRERRSDDTRVALVIVRQRQHMITAALEDPGNPRLAEAREYRPVLGQRRKPCGLHDGAEIRILRAALDCIDLDARKPERNVDLDERLRFAETSVDALTGGDLTHAAASDRRDVPAERPGKVNELAAGQRPAQRSGR